VSTVRVDTPNVTIRMLVATTYCSLVLKYSTPPMQQRSAYCLAYCTTTTYATYREVWSELYNLNFGAENLGPSFGPPMCIAR
jgi:hypothetical protein